MRSVFVSSKVASRIENLKKAGKAGAALARKASRIIESLTSGAVCHHMDTIASYTKYGEKRIKNCRKYDLGCGYRLITLQRGVKVFIPFFGTHDECQRWLEGNSRLKNFLPGSGTLFRISFEKQPSKTPASENDGACGEDADDELLRKLTDKLLRRIFSGLIEAAEKRRRAIKP
jgi:hypothetical protein